MDARGGGLLCTCGKWHQESGRGWVEERKQAGWTRGPKDLEKKTSPHLVRWNQLDEDTREIDRVFIRGLPRFLARAGFQIVRVEEGDGPDRTAE